MPGNLFTAVTISRRSAAEGGADAPSVTSKTARRTANTLTNASDQLSCSWWTVVRAKCTAASLLPCSDAAAEAGEQQERREAMGKSQHFFGFFAGCKRLQD